MITKKSRAIDAIRTVHTDRSMELSETLEALREIQEEVQELIFAVEDDLESE